ncbi:MAG: hypothetical protein M0P12_00735 [Paludibacteraceae bacterium]|nr:hypothetical protein [Paludibacteraceae bacterium]MCK9616096.1 hypothetical protein [Candidatus Omnitrophota bacterium]
MNEENKDIDNDESKKEEQENKTSALLKTSFSDKEGLEKAAFRSVTESVKGTQKEPKKPSFFMEPDQAVRIDVDVWSDPETGRILSVTKKGDIESQAMEKLILKTEQWFEFSVPNFDDVCIYRQKSSRFIGKEQVIDTNLFRNFILLGHLKSWSMQDSSGNPVEIIREKEGSLSVETIDWINRLHTVIWDIVFTLFERQTLIS